MTIREEIKKYWFYAGEWHDAECSFILHDAGVCNCHCGENRKELEELFQSCLRDSLERIRFDAVTIHARPTVHFEGALKRGMEGVIKLCAEEVDRRIDTEIKRLGDKQ